ncbi:hypothetical protein PO124_09390 [Bacillus licheniformis]|nr:hypothetical protein [Bacillus licheniformis]
MSESFCSAFDRRSRLLTLVVAEIVSGTAYLAKILPLQFNKAALYIESFLRIRSCRCIISWPLFDGLEAAQQESIITQVQIWAVNSLQARLYCFQNS